MVIRLKTSLSFCEGTFDINWDSMHVFVYELFHFSLVFINDLHVLYVSWKQFLLFIA